MSVSMIGAIDIHNPEGYKSYRAAVPEALAPYLDGVEFLSGDDNPLVLEGAQPTNHLFINKFPSIEVVKEFYHSKPYQKAMRYRRDSATTKFILLMRGRDEPLEEVARPAYTFAAIDIKDMDAYELYRKETPKAIAAYPDLKVLSADDHPFMLEGTQPANHLVLSRCASVDRFKAFYDSKAYQSALRHRLKGSDSRFYMVMRGNEKTRG